MYEILGIVTLALIPAFIVLDLVVQSRTYRRPRSWRWRALAVTVANVLLAGEVAALWGGLFNNSLLDLSGLGVAGGAVVGIVVYELLHYWYHRMAHRWTWLWRASHQMHHSAESLDAFGANYLHPLDAAIFTTMASLVFFPLLGLATGAGVIAALFLTFNAMFQHANIRTPRWLGYLIQRPESHAIHHGQGIHRHNYSDLPLWDMVFGTFVNPARGDVDDLPVGFYQGASARIPEMLIGRDVSSRPAAPAERLPEPEMLEEAA